MENSVLVDNDIILKICCYDAVEELTECLAGKTRTMQVLGAARYVLRKVISKRRNIVDKHNAVRCLERILTTATEIEPTYEELMLAARFEEAAQEQGLDLDSGESQLLAVLIGRSALLLVTGDKRAVRAIEPIVIARGYDHQVAGRVACLEQIVMTLIERYGIERFRDRVCNETEIDMTMTICFKCASGSYCLESVAQSLNSYIGDIRRHAPNVLVNSDKISTVIPKEDGIR
jgi:hypothetical protein